MAALPVYRIRAVNTAPESENRIHSDEVASQYGFSGGLVPGVTVYGYLMAPFVEAHPEWMERGSAQVRFQEPFYDGEDVIVNVDDGKISGTNSKGAVCATATAAFRDLTTPQPSLLPEHPLARREPSPETMIPGEPLGSFEIPLDLSNSNKFPTAVLLQYSNEILVRNFFLGPWIHVGSEVVNWGVAQHGDPVSARARVHDRFERKGHEFVVVDVTLSKSGRLIQSVRHTAIYRPKRVSLS